MAKVQLEITTEDAITNILGVISLINGKAALNDERLFDRHAYEGLGYRVLEDVLAVSAKVLDLELYEGQLTESMLFVEGGGQR